MTYKDKLFYIEDAGQRLAGGLSWDAFQEEMKGKSSLYQKDIDEIGRKAIMVVEKVHGTRIHAELLSTAGSASPGGLDASIFEKVRTRQEDTIRNTIKNKIARAVVEGQSFEQAVAANRHPLLKEEDVVQAAQRARNKLANPDTGGSSGGGSGIGIGTVIVVILIIVRIVMRMANN